MDFNPWPHFNYGNLDVGDAQAGVFNVRSTVAAFQPPAASPSPAPAACHIVIIGIGDIFVAVAIQSHKTLSVFLSQKCLRNRKISAER